MVTGKSCQQEIELHAVFGQLVCSVPTESRKAQMKCPKCRHYMRDDAQVHSCGWTSAVPLAVQCAHEGCLEPAIIRAKLPTGWANLCKACDLFHVQKEANKFCT